MRCFGGTVHCPAVAATPWALFPLSRSPPLSPLPQLGTGTCLCLFSCRRPLQLLFHNASPPRELHHCTLFPLPRNLIFPVARPVPLPLRLRATKASCCGVQAGLLNAARSSGSTHFPYCRPTALPGCDSPFVLEPFSLHFTFTCSTGRLHFLAAAEFSIDHVASSLPLIEFVFFS
ncbi:hypothetical protein J3E69DRAFT_238862 [Trichoderma sp. SZMC 28015]